MLVGYSRTAVANAETGHAQIGRYYWERADRVLVPGIKRARRFRREYSGPATRYVREFDGQLQTALQ